MAVDFDKDLPEALHGVQPLTAAVLYYRYVLGFSLPDSYLNVCSYVHGKIQKIADAVARGEEPPKKGFFGQLWGRGVDGQPATWAERAGVDRETANMRAWSLVSKAALRPVIRQLVALSLVDSAPEALAALRDSLTNERATVRERNEAARALLDRAGFGPVAPTQRTDAAAALGECDLDTLARMVMDKARAAEIDVTPGSEAIPDACPLDKASGEQAGQGGAVSDAT